MYKSKVSLRLEFWKRVICQSEQHHINHQSCPFTRTVSFMKTNIPSVLLFTHRLARDVSIHSQNPTINSSLRTCHSNSVWFNLRNKSNQIIHLSLSRNLCCCCLRKLYKMLYSWNYWHFLKKMYFGETDVVIVFIGFFIF